ncbi:MAG: hypothetical protein RIT81_03280 [Deltaproteobacteria bacterium]
MTAGQQLGSLLIDMGFIDAAQLESALEEQQRSGMRLGKILVRAGVITEERLVHALSRQLGIEPCDPIMTPIHERVLALVPAALAFKHHVLPIARQREDSRDGLYVATSDPLDKTALQALRAVVGTNTRVRWMLAGETEMELALARHYGEAPKPSSDIPVIQGRPVSGPVERASAFSTPPRGVSPPMGQSTADIAAALSVAMGETPLPASRMQSMGSKDLLPLSSGETSDDILIAEDVVESGAFPAVNELVDAVHRPPEVNLDDALAAAFDEEVRSSPPPLTDQATQQSGLSASSPFLGDASSRDPADVAIDEAFAGLTSGSESESSNEAVDAALAGTSTDPGVAPEAPGDDDAFPPPEPGGAFAGVDEPRGATNGAVDEAPTSIPEPTAPEPAAQDVDTGPSWGDLLDPALSWGSSLTPTSAPTGAPTEDFEIPEPADSALPTMIAEPQAAGVETVDASPEDLAELPPREAAEAGTQTIDAEVPEGMFGAPGELIGAPDDDEGATSSPQFGGSAKVPPADAAPEVPPDLASTVSAERVERVTPDLANTVSAARVSADRVTPDLANTVSAERVSADRVTPDLANTVTVDRVQRPSAGPPEPNEAERAAPDAENINEAVVRALADDAAESPRLGAGAEPSPPDDAAALAEVAETGEAAEPTEVAEPGAASDAFAVRAEAEGAQARTPQELAADAPADDEAPRADAPAPVGGEAVEAQGASPLAPPSVDAPREDRPAPIGGEASEAQGASPLAPPSVDAPREDRTAPIAGEASEAQDASPPSLDAPAVDDTPREDRPAPVAGEAAPDASPLAPSHGAPADDEAPRADAPAPPPADVATLPDPPSQGAEPLPHDGAASRPPGADAFVPADPLADAAASPGASRPPGADAFVHAEPSANAASPDAPLPLGADAFAHAERALDPDAPVPLPAEALVEAPSDADDLPDASEDIELAEVAEGPPTGEHVRALVERFAAGADLDDEDTVVVMRALAAALLESGRFDDEHLAALVRRLTPPVT